MAPTVLVLANMLSVFSTTPSDRLTAEELVALRNAVYKGDLVSVSRNRDFHSELELPMVLTEFYKKSPDAVIDLLARIADGAPPGESFIAVCYGLELGKRGVGELLARNSDSEMYTTKYDVVQKDWGHTPREHWVGRLRAKLKK
jgi:hypothetical protein